MSVFDRITFRPPAGRFPPLNFPPLNCLNLDTETVVEMSDDFPEVPLTSEEYAEAVTEGVRDAVSMALADVGIWSAIHDGVASAFKAQFDAAPHIADTVGPEHEFPRHLMRAVEQGVERAMREARRECYRGHRT